MLIRTIPLSVSLEMASPNEGYEESKGDGGANHAHQLLLKGPHRGISDGIDDSNNNSKYRPPHRPLWIDGCCDRQIQARPLSTPIHVSIRPRSSLATECWTGASAASDSPALHYPTFRRPPSAGGGETELNSDALVGCMRWLGSMPAGGQQSRRCLVWKDRRCTARNSTRGLCQPRLDKRQSG
jgi:hypothetical protein